MQSLLHIAATADAVSAAITTAWAAASSLIEAATLLAVLNFAANLIRTTYNLGAFCGRLLWPLLHLLAAAIRLIDWRFTALVALETAKALAAFTITVVATAGPLLIRASELLGRWYSALLVEPITPSQDPAAPAVEPAPLAPLPAKPAPRKRAARAKPATAPKPPADRAASPRPRRQRSVAPAS